MPNGLRAAAVRGFALCLLCLVAACANQAGHGSRTAAGSGGILRYYPPPGPKGDPWGPYVTEASRRFQVPERWIRQVMRQESGGQSDAVSSAGAMGLMQVMPATYEILRRRYGLGDDPFDPHNNMLAGTAYLREMYDRYGSPGFLAAYNAGPGRVDLYLAGGSPLPDETVNYVASIAPRLGSEVPVSGPLAVYAQAGASMDAVPAALPRGDGCDPDAAYDPDRVCTPVPPAIAAAPVSPVVAAPLAEAAAGNGCDPDAAYDPTQPCRPAPAAEPAPPQPHIQLASATWPAAAESGWAIQVGAFGDPGVARAATDRARRLVPDLLWGARVALPATTPFGGAVLYRARLGALSPVQAAQSCARLNAVQQACMMVPPAGGS